MIREEKSRHSGKKKSRRQADPRPITPLAYPPRIAAAPRFLSACIVFVLRIHSPRRSGSVTLRSGIASAGHRGEPGAIR